MSFAILIYFISSLAQRVWVCMVLLTPTFLFSFNSYICDNALSMPIKPITYLNISCIHHDGDNPTSDFLILKIKFFSD